MPIKLEVGVKILLKNKKGKYLLLKRSQEEYKDIKDIWDIPGGRISPRSSLIENLKREIKEETGLEFSGDIKIIGAQDIFKNKKHIVRISYTGNIDGNPTLSNEHVDYKWATLSEIKNLKDLDFFVSELLKKNISHETK